MQHKSAGFSLPEVILIVAVLAIVSGMAFPDMASFFARQRLEQERTELEQIKRAMEVYARQCGRLPQATGNNADCKQAPGAGGLTWYTALAGVSNLSETEIQTDTWGVPRRYTYASDPNVNFLGGSGSMAFEYASVRSNGPNRCNDTNGDTATCPHFPSGGFPAQPDWNLDGSGGAPRYNAFVPAADDMIVKFTDNQIKAAAYEETLRRLERVIAALDRYAQAKFNEAVVLGTDDCIGEQIFYPPSAANGWASGGYDNPSSPCSSANGGPISDYTSAHADSVKDDVTNVTPGGTAYLGTDVADDDQRRENMEALMRLLGLPLDHCCSALTDTAFFYFSSPGVGDAPCNANNYARRPPYFPPKVAVTGDGCQ